MGFDRTAHRSDFAATAGPLERPLDDEQGAVEQSLLSLVVQHIHDAGVPENNHHRDPALSIATKGALEPRDDQPNTSVPGHQYLEKNKIRG